MSVPASAPFYGSAPPACAYCPLSCTARDIAAARLLHIDGFDIDAAAYAASIARSLGIPVSLDVDTVYPGFETVLRNVDYLVASSSWPAKWTGEKNPVRALGPAGT